MRQQLACLEQENARLFQELEVRNRELQESNRQAIEACEQQTATGAILRVIAGSPTELQPVLGAIAESAARLCDASRARMYRIDGGIVRVAASCGLVGMIGRGERRPLTRGTLLGRAMMDQRTIHVHDILSELDDEFAEARDLHLHECAFSPSQPMTLTWVGRCSRPPRHQGGLLTGERLLSAYTLDGRRRVWVITQANRLDQLSNPPRHRSASASWRRASRS
jgi:hypothetical protein